MSELAGGHHAGVIVMVVVVSVVAIAVVSKVFPPLANAP